MTHATSRRPNRARVAPLFGALALLALAGCAVPTQQAFDARQATLLGRSEAELVASLGVPDRVHEVDGRRFLQYEERRLISYGGGGGFYGPSYAGLGLGFGYGRRGLGYGGFYGGGFAPTVETRACDLTFELRDGRVFAFNRRGNDCVATPVASAS